MQPAHVAATPLTAPRSCAVPPENGAGSSRDSGVLLVRAIAHRGVRRCRRVDARTAQRVESLLREIADVPQPPVAGCGCRNAPCRVDRPTARRRARSHGSTTPSVNRERRRPADLGPNVPSCTSEKCRRARIAAIALSGVSRVPIGRTRDGDAIQDICRGRRSGGAAGWWTTLSLAR